MRCSSMPPSIVRSSSTRPTGSGSDARSSSARAMLSTRCSLSSRRSSKPSLIPADLPAFISSAFALTMAAECSRSARAIANNAALRWSVVVRASAAEALRAASAIERTEVSKSAMSNLPFQTMPLRPDANMQARANKKRAGPPLENDWDASLSSLYSKTIISSRWMATPSFSLIMPAS